MTQLQTMSDQELNRKLAELMGYTVYHYDKDVEERCYFELTDPEGYPEIVFGGERKTDTEAWADAPDYCTEPAASLEVQAKAIEVSAEKYVRSLSSIIDSSVPQDGMWDMVEIMSVATLLTASPRERAEAAYMTLQAYQVDKQ